MGLPIRDRDPHRRHAAHRTPAPAQLSARHPADHAGTAGAAALAPPTRRIFRRPAARRARRTARARHLEARRSSLARAGTALRLAPALIAASAFRRRSPSRTISPLSRAPARRRRGAGRYPASPTAAPRRSCTMLDTAERAAVGRPLGAPRAGRDVRPHPRATAPR